MKNLKIKNLPKKFQKIWKKCLALFKQGRPGDDEHAKETVEMILNYKGKIKIDRDILIPVAMMHDIGHAAILPEHFKYITGSEKIANGKLAHMLTGAKIASNILKSIEYPREKTIEIVEIISMHDADQLNISNAKIKMIYDTENKKIFHDFDSLDRYNEKRLKHFFKLYKDRNELLDILNKMMKNFFYKEFRKIAGNNLKKLK